jgi:hypothetical protein
MYTPKTTGLSNVRGTHYDGQAYPSYIHYVRQAPSGTIGSIYKVRITPAEKISEGTTTLLAGAQLSLDNTGPDISWNGTTRVLTGLFGTRFTALIPRPLGEITPEDLAAAAYPAGTLNQPSGVYGVKISTSGNFAKIRIYQQGTQTKMDWVTYGLGTAPIFVGALDGVPEPRDLVFTPDGEQAYVTAVQGMFTLRRTGSGLASPWERGLDSTTLYQVNQTELSQPQQMYLDGNGVDLYVLDESALWHVDTTNGTTTQVAAGFVSATGLVANKVGGTTTAYICDQSGLHAVDLTGRTLADPPITAGATPMIARTGDKGFLSWADGTHTILYMPVHGSPSGAVVRIDLESGEVSEITDVPAEPWTVEAVSDCDAYLASATEVGVLELCIPATGDLLMGIGHVPFQYISPVTGRADTTPATGYFFQVRDVPFGGSLHLIMFHTGAWNVGIRGFRVSLRNLVTGVSRVITHPFGDLLWNPIASLFMPTTVTATALGSTDKFPIRNPADRWYSPYRAAIIPTGMGDNGLNMLKIEFFDANGALVDTQERTILVDNRRTEGQLFLPRSGNPVPSTYPTADCGCLQYVSKNDFVEVDFSASHPDGLATYRLSFFRGSAHLPNLQESGPVTVAPQLRTKSLTSGSTAIQVGHIVGNCNVATVRIDLSVPSYVIDGYSWINYGVYRTVYFTYVPNTVPASSPWP